MSAGETMIVGWLCAIVATLILRRPDSLFDRICGGMLCLGAIGYIIAAIGKGALS